jgi:hypothetical protein
MKQSLSFLKLFFILIYLQVGYAQAPVLKPANKMEEPLPVTNRGIHISKIENGQGRIIVPGDYIFCTFYITYRDSVLHASTAVPMDNVVFIPLDYERNPNAAIYEVFTFLKEGDKAYFDIPFKMLPWKDGRLGDNDTIRYSMQVDSVRSEKEYLILYDQFLRDEELKLEKNADWILTLKQDIRIRLQLYDQQDRQSGFIKHPEGYWYALLRSGEGDRVARSLSLRYMLLFKDDKGWNEMYFNPSKLNVEAGDRQLHPFLENVVSKMKPGQRELVLIPSPMAQSLGLHKEQVTGDLCFYLERIPLTGKE